MSKAQSQRRFVTVYSYQVYDLAWRGMQVVDHKATAPFIARVPQAQRLDATAEEVPADAVDAQGRFRRVATGWGALA